MTLEESPCPGLVRNGYKRKELYALRGTPCVRKATGWDLLEKIASFDLLRYRGSRAGKHRSTRTTHADQPSLCLQAVGECPVGLPITVRRLLSGPLQFNGKLDLSDNSDNTFHILEYYGPQNSPPPEKPYEIYFGRWLCNGQRDFINHYHLQKRRFIGNTSMDPTLSMIMSNMAKVSSGMLVCDPFVGTGSLLVACAHFGGHVLGTDIDYNLLVGVGKSSRAGQKWRSKEESIRNNLRQYGLERFYVDTLIADASLHGLWRDQEFLDAVVADPPYGVREPTVKVGSKKEVSSIDEEHKDGHIPCKTNYSMSDIIVDLLHFAAKFLVLGGRLVFWIPVLKQNYKESNIPQHPCFELVANSEQILNLRVSRRLLTMEKTRHYEDEMAKGAVLVEDHYKDASFREQYFRPANKPRGNQANGFSTKNN